MTNAGLEQLRGLANLRVLYLRSAKVSGDGVASLKKALPNCKIVPSPESWYLKTRERNLENRPKTNLTEARIPPDCGGVRPKPKDLTLASTTWLGVITSSHGRTALGPFSTN